MITWSDPFSDVVYVLVLTDGTLVKKGTPVVWRGQVGCRYVEHVPAAGSRSFLIHKKRHVVSNPDGVAVLADYADLNIEWREL